MKTSFEINKPVGFVRQGGPPFDDLVKLANLGWRGTLTLNPRDLVGPSAWRAASRVFAMPEPSMNIQGQAAWLCYITGQLTGMPYVRIPKTRAHVDIIGNRLTTRADRETAGELIRAAVAFASLRGAVPYSTGGRAFTERADAFIEGQDDNFWFGFDNKLSPGLLAGFLKQWMWKHDWPKAQLVNEVTYTINRQGGLPL